MCTGLEIAALAAAAGGTAMQAKAQNDLSADRARMAREDAARNMALNRRAGERVNQQIQELTKSNPAAEENTAQRGFMDALRRAQITGEGGVKPAGAVSDRYADEAGIAKTQGEAENARTANQLARIDAPMYQRQREGRAITDTAIALDRLKSQGSGQDFLSQLRASMLRPNDALMAGGALLSSFGQAYAGRAQPQKVYNPRMSPGLAAAFDTGAPAFDTRGLS